MKKILFLFFLSCAALTIMETKAIALDSLSVIIDSSNYVARCDDSSGFKVTVRNTGSTILTNVRIQINLGSGVYWTSTNGPDSISSNHSIIVFKLGSLILPPGAVDTFSYYVMGYCSLIPDGTHHDVVFVNYAGGTGTHAYSFIHDFQVQSPNLIYNNDSSQNMSVDGYMGLTFTRELFFKNDGNAPLVNGQIHFIDSHGPAIKINNIQIFSGIILLASSIDTDTVASLIPLLDHGDSLRIVENITVIGCLDGGTGNSFDTTTWGCNGSMCDTIPVTAIVYRSLLSPLPFFKVKNNLNDSTCEGSMKHWQIAICDTSLVPCQHFSFLFSRHGTQYSLIDAHTFSVTTNDPGMIFEGSTVHILDTSEHFYNNACYSTVGDSALDNIKFNYENMKKGDTVFLDFYTYVCCASDTNSLFLRGPGPAYVFNDWYIKLHWNDECGAPDSSQNFISPYDAQGYIQLIQEFQPQVTDMNGSHTLWANADSASFFITNTGFTNQLPDSFYRYYNKGYLMVKIKTDLGLRYKSTVYFSNYNNTETWYPYRVDSTIGDTVLINQLYGGYQDSITAYFRFDTLTNFDSLYYFLIRSQINFQLYSYCNAAAPRSRFFVETMWRNDTTCADCLIPLNRQGGQIQVHCPGCEIPGFVATSYRLNRISKGEKDDNNDGIMDSHTPATDALINHSRGIVGDTLIGMLVANIVNGYEVDSVHGATLAFVEDTLFPLNYCYLYTTLDYSKNFRILDVTVTITDSTHLPIYSQSGLTSIVEHNYNLYGNRYLYDLSLGTLQANGLDPGYTYNLGDIFTVVTKYRIDSNTLNTQQLPNIVNIANTIYLTGIADDLSHDPVINYPTAGDVNAAFGRDSLKPQDLFWCEAYSGLFYQYPINITNESVFYNSVSNDDYCDKYAVCEARSYIGGLEAGFVFPFEYRQPPVLDTIRFTLPQGYSLNGATSFLRYPFWIQPYWYNAYYERINVPYTSGSINSFGDSVYLYVVPPLYSYLDSLPLETTYLTDSVPIADEIYNYKLFVYISPTCGVTPENTYIIDSLNFNYHNRQPQMVFNDTIYQFLGIDSTIRVPSNAIPWYSQVLTLAHPVADLVITSNTQTVSTQEVCWDFFVLNSSPDEEPIDNMWAYLYSPSGRVTLDNVYLMPGNILLTVTADSIIHLDNLILPDSIAYFEICCHFSCDTAGAKDSMVLYYGWNCFNYPLSIRDPNLCNEDSAVFNLTEAGAALQWTVVGPDTASNCSILNYKIVITASEYGSEYDFTATVNLPSYLTYIAGSGVLEYPGDSLTTTVGPIISGGDTLFWNLDSTNFLLHTLGIGDGDSLVLFFSLLDSCGFHGDSITATITGITFCGQTLTIHPQFPQVVMTSCPTCCHLSTSYDVTNVRCFGEHNGRIIASTSDGTGPYTYTWSPIVSYTATASNLLPGTYTVTVTDFTGCSRTDIISISQPPPLNVNFPVANIVNDSCFGTSNGRAIAQVFGGMPSYSYSWSPNTSSSDTATGLSAGTYTVTVTDANGCTKSATVTITQPPVLAVNTFHINENCFGDSTGIAGITIVTGGTMPYTFAWNTVPVQTTPAISHLPAGIYIVTVTDLHGCTATASDTITQPPLLTASITSQINVLCFGNSTGSATVTAGGGTPGYNYLWNTIPMQNNDTAFNLSAGTYTVTVTDSLGCTATASVTITQPDSILTASIPITSVINVNCFGDSTGSASVTVNGGIRPYSYSWSTTPTQTTDTAIGLAAGIYMVTVTDANGCTAISLCTISQTLTPLMVVFPPGMQVMDSCFGLSDGRLMVFAFGGSPGYTYLWTSLGDSTPIANGLAAGTYTVLVTDSLGCTAIGIDSITQPNLLIATITDTLNVLCFGNATGSATVTANGGTAPYFYSWSTTPIQVAPVAVGLSAGTYTVTVTDINGCSATASITITQPSTPLSVIATFSSVTCYDSADVIAIAIPSGGTPFSAAPYYTFSWTPSSQTTQTATGLGVGIYVVTVKDSNGCIATDTVTIFPLSAIISATYVSCIPNANDGTATVSVLGGSSPYTYLWSNGQTDTLADNLSVGIYYVTVTDSNGCTLIDSINIKHSDASCCYDSLFTNLILNDTTFTTSFTYPIGSTIAVTGNITVSGATLNFNGCDVKLAPGIEIDVINCGVLKIDSSSHLHAACDTMWHQILLEKCSYLYVNNNSLIEDADTAVHSVFGGQYYIDSSEFNKNYIGIYLDGNGNSSNHSTVTRTNFYCKNSSGDNANCLLTPHFLDLSNTGIKVVNFVDYPVSWYAPLVIGGVGVGNSFEYMDYGIVGYNSTNTDIVNNNFKHIIVDGITIDQKGYTTVEYQNNFELCHWGVHTSNYVNTDVKWNNFANCVYGVETQIDQGATLNVDISANTFNVNEIDSILHWFSVMPYSAIHCYMDDGATHNIWGNYINNSYDDNMIFGIFCEQFDNTILAPYNIFYNKIYNCTFGIFGSNLNNPLIYEQDSNSYHDGGIYVQSYPINIGNYTSGIILEGCSTPQVYYNNITGLSGNENTYWLNCGIRVENSDNINIYCNEVGNVSMGLWLGGLLPVPVVKGNIMDSCFDQLYLNYNSGLGTQGSTTTPSDNQWTTTPISSNTYAYYSNSSGTLFYTRCCGNYDPTINNFIGYTPCAIINTATGPDFCAAAPDAIEYSSDEKNYESRIAGDSILWGENLDAYKWLAKQYLYKRFLEDSTLASQNSVLQNAKDSLSQTNIATIKTIKDTFATADTLVGIDSLSNIQDSVLRQQAFATATTINSGINPAVTIEQNYKTVNSIYLNTVAVSIDTFTNDQYTQLVNIAEQCPYSGGPAVYSARALLHIADTTFYGLNACDNFNQNNNDRIAKKDSSSKNIIFGKLYPNPNDGNMQYDYSLPTGSTGELSIFDVTGRTLVTYHLTQGKNSLIIDQTTLSNGVYLYKVAVNNILVSENKLVIVK